MNQASTIIAPRTGARPARRSRYGRGIGTIAFGRPRLRRKRLAEFTRSLATLLDAGLPLVRCLRSLERQSRDVLEKRLIASLIDQIEGGSTLSDALREQPRSFDRFYVNMIRAGEASGALDNVLNQLATYLERSATMKAKVKAALTYPAVVLTVAMVITGALMIFIVPKFAVMFQEMLAGEQLPPLTLFVLGISRFLAHHFVLGVAAIVLVVVAYRLIRRTAPGAYALDYVKLHLPPFNDLVGKVHAARFCSTLSTLIASGVSVLQALQITRDTCGNAVVARAVQTIHDSVKEGEGIARPMDNTAVFPMMMVSMVEVGEETGALPEMLRRVAHTYEERVDMAVDALTSLIEPLMIVVLGVLIGGIVLAMFMPLFRLLDLMSGSGAGN